LLTASRRASWCVPGRRRRPRLGNVLVLATDAPSPYLAPQLTLRQLDQSSSRRFSKSAKSDRFVVTRTSSWTLAIAAIWLSISLHVGCILMAI
jgi:hypothetical protein